MWGIRLFKGQSASFSPTWMRKGMHLSFLPTNICSLSPSSRAALYMRICLPICCLSVPFMFGPHRRPKRIKGELSFYESSTDPAGLVRWQIGARQGGWARHPSGCEGVSLLTSWKVGVAQGEGLSSRADLRLNSLWPAE